MSLSRTKKRRARTAKAAPEIFQAPEVEVPFRGEQAWLRLVHPGPEEDDRWGSVEEHLLSRERERDHSLRRWKYFSK